MHAGRGGPPMMRLLRSRPAPIAATAVLLLLGLVPLPHGWARSARESARSLGMDGADREANGGSYYEGLINGGGPKGARGDLALRLLGKPTDWISFHDIRPLRYW